MDRGILIIPAVIFVLTALIFYTSAMYVSIRTKNVSHRLNNLLKTGLMFDATATILMVILSGSIITTHGMVGYTALIFMFYTSRIADDIYTKNNVQRSGRFHRQMIFAWIVWMIAFLSSFILR